MICPRLQQIKIIEVWENFVWQGTRPECTDTPAHRESYKFPFVRDCEGKDNCIISSTFLETNGLFSAATYILPDAHLYNIPIRIDIQYECISKFDFWICFAVFMGIRFQVGGLKLLRYPEREAYLLWWSDVVRWGGPWLCSGLCLSEYNGHSVAGGLCCVHGALDAELLDW